MNELHKLIAEAYQLFSNYQLGEQMAVCTYCCLSEKAEKNLKTMRLNELDSYTIYQYLDSAICGNEILLINQIRYLLPRILELFIDGEYIRHSEEIILDKLHCDNPIWLTNEIDFLQRFAMTYFQYCLHSKEIEGLIEVVIMFDNAKLPTQLIDKIFDIFLNNAGNLNLAVINELMFILSQRKIEINAFASDELNKKFADFLYSENFKSAVINDILKKVDEPNLTIYERNTYEIAFDVFSNM